MNPPSDSTGLAYLVGAGASIPPPSSLPGAGAFIELLLQKVVDDPGVRADLLARCFTGAAQRRFVGDFLRFEAVLGCVKMAVDDELEILQVLSRCDAPGPYHFFLAKQLRRGALVLTTNFDNLIETACRCSDVEYSLVVSDEEFEAFRADPARFPRPIVKLHGGYDVLHSDGSRTPGGSNLKSTLSDMGRSYLAPSSAHVSALAVATRTRRLVVMGYSGCDDFDVMPFLLRDRLEHGLTWVHHAACPAERLTSRSPSLGDLPPNRLLARRDESGLDIEVVCGDSARILAVPPTDICAPASRAYRWAEVFEEWAGRRLACESARRLLLGVVLNTAERLPESIRVLANVDPEGLNEQQASVLQFVLGSTHAVSGRPRDAIVYFSGLVEAEGAVGGLSLKGLAYYNLARICTDLARPAEANAYLRAATRILERGDDLGRLEDCWYEAGRVLIELGKFGDAVAPLRAALRAAEMVGDLAGAGAIHAEIARALIGQGKLDQADAELRSAIDVLSLEGNRLALGVALHGMGFLLSERGDWKGAAKAFETAIEHEREAGAERHQSHSLHCLGDMLLRMGELDAAEARLEESLRIKRAIEDSPGIEHSEELLRAIHSLRGLGSRASRA